MSNHECENVSGLAALFCFIGACIAGADVKIFGVLISFLSLVVMLYPRQLEIVILGFVRKPVEKYLRNRGVPRQTIGIFLNTNCSYSERRDILRQFKS